MDEPVRPGVYAIKGILPSVRGYNPTNFLIMTDGNAFLMGRGKYPQQSVNPDGSVPPVPKEQLTISTLKDEDGNPVPAPDNWRDLLGEKLEGYNIL